MKKDAYEELISEISKPLAEKILLEEGDLAGRVETIAGISRFLPVMSVREPARSSSRKPVMRDWQKKAQGLKPSRNSVIEYNVIFGVMERSLPYLWPNGEIYKPMIDDLGITHQSRTETVNRALTDFGIEDSFAQAGRRFEEHYGFELSATTVDRVTKASALHAEAYLERKLREAQERYDEASPSRNEPILVELDACEIRTGVFTAHEEHPGRKKTVRWRDVRVGLARPMTSRSKLFGAQVEKYPEVVSQLFSLAAMLGMTRQTTVVAVADGGPGVREQMESKLPVTQFILDKPHLKKHLYETAEASGFYEEQQQQWVHSKLDSISGGTRSIGFGRAGGSKHHGAQRDRLRRFNAYLRRFEDAVDYDHFKELGYPIGSGEVESAHRSVPQRRLKLPGACWHPDSINPLLALRVLRANDWWNDYCAQRTSTTDKAA
jgi:hypothetical protein